MEHSTYLVKCLLAVILTLTDVSAVTTDAYMAAVYEHEVTYPTHRDVVDRQTALRMMHENLVVYAEQAAEAVKQVGRFAFAAFIGFM